MSEDTRDKTLNEKLDEISARISPEIKALSKLSNEELRKFLGFKKSGDK